METDNSSPCYDDLAYEPMIIDDAPLAFFYGAGSKQPEFYSSEKAGMWSSPLGSPLVECFFLSEVMLVFYIRGIIISRRYELNVSGSTIFKLLVNDYESSHQNHYRCNIYNYLTFVPKSTLDTEPQIYLGYKMFKEQRQIIYPSFLPTSKTMERTDSITPCYDEGFSANISFEAPLATFSEKSVSFTSSGWRTRLPLLWWRNRSGIVQQQQSEGIVLQNQVQYLLWIKYNVFLRQMTSHENQFPQTDMLFGCGSNQICLNAQSQIQSVYLQDCASVSETRLFGIYFDKVLLQYQISLSAKFLHKFCLNFKRPFLQQKAQKRILYVHNLNCVTTPLQYMETDNSSPCYDDLAYEPMIIDDAPLAFFYGAGSKQPEFYSSEKAGMWSSPLGSPLVECFYQK
ncbi:Hypothetical_protein [Hexamita inflata]|uniref:Hypothetical_protein n=1 Tax=Hexamita inflata TaxID=28002 RepID=A0AA86R551_9EUKA|nr:Hypothetical protein HINF_LOCUS53963 [Hexamita inflata]